MKLTSVRIALALAATLTLGQICFAQNAPDAAPEQAAPDQTAPVPDPSQPTTPAAPASAKPDAKPVDPYANILGPEVKLLGYSIRPPKDYTYGSPLPDTRGIRNFVWQGALHQDGYVTSLVVGVMRPHALEPNAEREFMIGIYKGLSKTLTNTAMSPSQPGTVGGLPALRATWGGKLVTPHSRLTIQGFVYVIQDGTILLSIAGTDSAPYFTTTFATLNASALSLHK